MTTERVTYRSSLCRGHIFTYRRSVRATLDKFREIRVRRGYLVAVTGSTWVLRGRGRGCHGVIRGATESLLHAPRNMPRMDPEIAT